MMCEICGKLGKRVLDPFLLDVHNEEVERILCDDCCQRRADDI